MKQLVQNNRSGEIAVHEVPTPVCGDQRILVNNRASLISLGTERSLILLGRKSIAGKARERPDLVRRFVEKARQEGIGKTVQEAMGRLDTLRPLGYSSAGVVARVGTGITSVSPGDRVACIGAGWATHSESVLMSPTLCSLLPDGVSFEDGAFGMLGIIALHGIRKANITFGEAVAVVGLGLIGLLTVQILRAYGIRVLGYDIDPRKSEVAAGLGIAAESGDWSAFARRATQCTDGNGLDAVILTISSADGKPVDRGVRLLRHGGRVVLVGVSDIHPSRQELWEREAEIVVSKAGGPGSLDPLYEERGIDYPYGSVRWTQQRNLVEFLRLVATERVRVGPLITHRCSVEDSAELYERMVDSRNELIIGIVIKYPEDRVVQGSTVIVRQRRPDPALNTAAARRGQPAVAVLGAGTFARSLLLPALLQVPDLRLKTLVTERGGAGSHAARKFRFEAHSTDSSAVIDDPEIDALIVATPHRLHASMVGAALEAGKHVFVEKPLCVDESQLAELQGALAAIPEQVRPHLAVGYNRRFSRHSRWVREAIGARVTPMVAHYRVSPGYLSPDHWVNDPEEGGGRVIGEACHFVDLLMYLTGSLPIRVYAERISGGGTAVANDNFVATLMFADGSVGAITYAAVGNRSYSREWFEIFADGKTVAMRDFRHSVLHGAGRRRKFTTRGQDMGYEQELRHFFGIVRGSGDAGGGASTVELFRSTLATIRIAEALHTGVPQETR